MSKIKARHVLLAAGGFLCWFALRQHAYSIPQTWWQYVFDEIAHVGAGIFGMWLVANYIMLTKKEQELERRAKRKNGVNRKKGESDGTVKAS